MNKAKWTVSRIRNRWLRGGAAWLVVLVSVPILLVLAILVAVEEGLRGFAGHVQDFFDEVIVPNWSMLSFRRSK